MEWALIIIFKISKKRELNKPDNYINRVPSNENSIKG